jgi:hypothetical protein
MIETAPGSSTGLLAGVEVDCGPATKGDDRQRKGSMGMHELPGWVRVEPSSSQRGQLATANDAA